jgi:hypothetical protein
VLVRTLAQQRSSGQGLLVQYERRVTIQDQLRASSSSPNLLTPENLQMPAPCRITGRVSSDLAGVDDHRESRTRIPQHSTILTARPPRAVSLYLIFMSAPVCIIVLITLSRLTVCSPSP